MKKFCNLLFNTIKWINALLLFVIIVLIFLQVLNRFLFKIGMPWTQEISILCFIWNVFLGAAVAVRSKSHFFINIWPMDRSFLQRLFNVLALLAILGVAIVLFVYGYQLALGGMGRFSRQLGMLMIYFLLPIPVSGLLIIIFIIEAFVTHSYLKYENEEVDTL